MSTNFSTELAAMVSNTVAATVTDLFGKFTTAVADECDVSIETLTSIWDRVAPEVATEIGAELARLKERKVTELKRIEQKQIQAAGPHCSYVFGDKANRAGEQCGSFCKNSVADADGNHFCSKHSKMTESKHTCEFVFGDGAKKAGECCGARIPKDSAKFEGDGDYDDKWLCKRHTSQANKAIDRVNNQCVHIFGEKSSKAGDRCTSAAKENGRCSKHIKAGEKSAAIGKARKDAANDSDDDEEKKAEPKTNVKKNGGKKTSDKKKDGKKKGDKKKKGKKIDVTIDFTVPDGDDERETDFTVVKVSSEDGKFYAMVDVNSGLVVTDTEETDNKKMKFSASNENIVAIGVWDAEDGNYSELTDDAAKYAESIGIKTEIEEEEEE